MCRPKLNIMLVSELPWRRRKCCSTSSMESWDWTMFGAWGEAYAPSSFSPKRYGIHTIQAHTSVDQFMLVCAFLSHFYRHIPPKTTNTQWCFSLLQRSWSSFWNSGYPHTDRRLYQVQMALGTKWLQCNCNSKLKALKMQISVDFKVAALETSSFYNTNVTYTYMYILWGLSMPVYLFIRDA